MNPQDVFKKLLADTGSETSKLAASLGNLEKVFTGLAPELKALEALIEAISKTILGPLTQALGEAMDSIKAVLETAMKPLGLVVKVLLTPIRMLAKLIELVTKPFEELFDLLGRLVEVPLKAFVKLIELVTKPFEELFDLLGRLVEVPLKAFGKLIEMLLAPLKPLIIAFTDLVEFLERTADMIGLSYKTLETLMKTGRKALAAAFDDVKKVLVDPISNLPQLMGKIRGMVEAIDPVIVQQFDLAMRDLTALFGRTLRPAFQAVVPLIYKFGEALKPVMDRIAPALAKFINSIGDFLTRMIPVFVDMLDDLIPLAEEYMNSIKKEISAKNGQLKMYRLLERAVLRIVNPVAAMRKDYEDRVREIDKAGEKKKKESIVGLASSQNPTYKGFQELGREISQKAFVLSNIPLGEKTKDQVQEEFQRKGISFFDALTGAGSIREQIEAAGAKARAAGAGGSGGGVTARGNWMTDVLGIDVKLPG